MITVMETFYTIQGEGRYMGTPSTFIRLKDCNLECKFCDSKFTWDETQPIPDTVDLFPIYNDLDIDLYIKKYDSLFKRGDRGDFHFVITGGEPLLYKNFDKRILPKFISRLIHINTDKFPHRKTHITFETTTLDMDIKNNNVINKLYKLTYQRLPQKIHRCLIQPHQ